VFEQRVTVQSSDLDERQHVNNVVYLRWVQDIATAHWRALASQTDQAELAWVALRHEIDYLAPAVLGDHLLLRTWVGHAERLSFERLTEVRRASDSTLIAKARTLWCPVDARSGRPKRVSAAVRSLFSSDAAAEPRIAALDR
jgi:acyl-CoA thioester hydrolase